MVLPVMVTVMPMAMSAYEVVSSMVLLGALTMGIIRRPTPAVRAREIAPLRFEAPTLPRPPPVPTDPIVPPIPIPIDPPTLNEMGIGGLVKRFIKWMQATVHAIRSKIDSLCGEGYCDRMGAMFSTMRLMGGERIKYYEYEIGSRPLVCHGSCPYQRHVIIRTVENKTISCFEFTLDSNGRGVIIERTKPDAVNYIFSSAGLSQVSASAVRYWNQSYDTKYNLWSHNCQHYAMDLLTFVQLDPQKVITHLESNLLN